MKSSIIDFVLFVLSVAFVAVYLAGCSVAEKVATVAQNDFTRTSELAAKYGKPEVQKCATFLAQSAATLKEKDKLLSELRSEQVNGLVSASFKAILLAELSKELAQETRDQFRADFPGQCGAVSTELLLRILEDAAGIAQYVR